MIIKQKFAVASKLLQKNTARVTSMKESCDYNRSISETFRRVCQLLKMEHLFLIFWWIDALKDFNSWLVIEQWSVSGLCEVRRTVDTKPKAKRKTFSGGIILAMTYICLCHLVICAHEQMCEATPTQQAHTIAYTFLPLVFCCFHGSCSPEEFRNRWDQQRQKKEKVQRPWFLSDEVVINIVRAGKKEWIEMCACLMIHAWKVKELSQEVKGTAGRRGGERGSVSIFFSQLKKTHAGVMVISVLAMRPAWTGSLTFPLLFCSLKILD